MIVIVASGDTLSGIASAHGESLSAIEAANPQITNPNVISVGEKVIVLSGGSSSPFSPPPSSSPSPSSSASPSPSPSSSASSSSLSSIPGVPASFAACVAFRESTNGTNAAYNGGVYGIITASGINVNGQSVAAQKQAFSQLYAQYGTAPWAADGC